MGNKTWLCWFVVVLECGLTGSHAGWAQSAPIVHAQLLVVVYDDGGVEHTLVQRAEMNAGRLFREAGVEVRWRNSGWERGNLAAVDGQMRLNLHILARARTLGDEVFGIAFVGEDGSGQQADVFYEAIAKANSHRAQDRTVLLGAVMAHELGHLLLGSHAHTGTGIMRAHWDEDTMQMIKAEMAGFNVEQGVRMRAKIARANETLSGPGLVAGLR